MRLGGPVFNDEIQKPQELVELHRKFGYSAAYCQYVKDPVERQEYREAFREADIVLAELGAYCINILDTDPQIREQNISNICRRLEQAEEMGDRCCVMHGGSLETGGWGKAHPENLSERSFERTVETVQRIIDAVKPQTTKLVIETESYVLPDSPEIYLRLFQAIDRKGFGIHLDPINLILSPRRYYFNASLLRECFELLGPHIVSCHAKDTQMLHHATVRIDETYVGNGNLDYEVYLQELSKLEGEPPLMIEHLNKEQLPFALTYIFSKAHKLGMEFRHSQYSQYDIRTS